MNCLFKCKLWSASLFEISLLFQFSEREKNWGSSWLSWVFSSSNREPFGTKSFVSTKKKRVFWNLQSSGCLDKNYFIIIFIKISIYLISLDLKLFSSVIKKSTFRPKVFSLLQSWWFKKFLGTQNPPSAVFHSLISVNPSFNVYFWL